MIKPIVNFLFCTAMICFFHTSVSAVNSKVGGKNTFHYLEESRDVSVEKMKLETELGRKLSLKEKFLLKIVHRKLKKKSNNTVQGADPSQKAGSSGKSQIVALILCIFLGLLGVHRFYLGYTFMGILYLLTAGLFGIGWLIDLILLIIPNGLTPRGQSRY